MFQNQNITESQVSYVSNYLIWFKVGSLLTTHMAHNSTNRSLNTNKTFTIIIHVIQSCQRVPDHNNKLSVRIYTVQQLRRLHQILEKCAVLFHLEIFIIEVVEMSESVPLWGKEECVRAAVQYYTRVLVVLVLFHFFSTFNIEACQINYSYVDLCFFVP